MYDRRGSCDSTRGAISRLVVKGDHKKLRTASCLTMSQWHRASGLCGVIGVTGSSEVTDVSWLFRVEGSDQREVRRQAGT